MPLLYEFQLHAPLHPGAYETSTNPNKYQDKRTDEKPTGFIIGS